MKKTTYSHFFCRKPFRPVFGATAIIVSVLLIVPACRAGSDLDDDISKYKDDPISKWDELGKETPNISFIIAEALGRTRLNEDKNVNINSVVIGPGSNVGDIYNVHVDETGGVIIPDSANNPTNNQSEDK
jgi:hypothetical protein